MSKSAYELSLFEEKEDHNQEDFKNNKNVVRVEVKDLPRQNASVWKSMNWENMISNDTTNKMVQGVKALNGQGLKTGLVWRQQMDWI